MPRRSEFQGVCGPSSLPIFCVSYLEYAGSSFLFECLLLSPMLVNERHGTCLSLKNRWINTSRGYVSAFIWVGAVEKKMDESWWTSSLVFCAWKFLHSLELSSIIAMLPVGRNPSIGKHNPVGGFPTVRVCVSLLPVVWCSQGREEEEVSSSLPSDDCVKANRGSSMFWRHLTHRTIKAVLGRGSFLFFVFHNSLASISLSTVDIKL